MSNHDFAAQTAGPTPLQPGKPGSEAKLVRLRKLLTRGKSLLWICVAGLIALVVISCSSYNTYREAPAGTPGAKYIGMNACTECHEDLVEEFKFTSHGHMRGDISRSCEACHGPGSIHAEEGEHSIVMPNDANCLACHGRNPHGGANASSGSYASNKRALIDWKFASHKRAGVKCIDCHSSHSTDRLGLKTDKTFQIQHTDAASALCLSCHQDILARISMPYHHPIREGAMSCLSCHDPHGNMSRQLLSKNETCFKCHQAQQGPFSREHQPVVEDCTICHDPHGSPVPKMTRVGQPMLCLQCHPLTMNRHQTMGTIVSPAALRDCTACHGAIHGSDIEPYFRH
jgi:DmsE family decaheme c-type cytochrome